MKVNTLNFWRVVFTFVIVLYHVTFKGNGLYIAVEFFFIVSGFLLCREYHKNTVKTSPVPYIKKRLTRFYPIAMVSFVIGFCFMVIQSNWSMGQIVKEFVNKVPEFFMLEGMNVVHIPLVNPPTWYLSVLLINSFLIYSMLYLNRKKYILIVAPVSIIVIYTYILSFFGATDTYSPIVSNFVNVGLIRGFAGMSLGCVIFEVGIKVQNSYNIEKMNPVIKIGEFLLFVFVIIYAFKWGRNSADIVLIGLIATGVLLSYLSMKPNIVQNNTVINYLAIRSYSIFVIHGILNVYIFDKIHWVGWNKYVVLVLFIALLIPCAELLYQFDRMVIINLRKFIFTHKLQK